jgi:hypothetical protein
MITTAVTHVKGVDLEWWQALAFGLVCLAIGVLYHLWRHRRNTPRFEALAEQYGGTYAGSAQARIETFAGTGWEPPSSPFPVENHLTGRHGGRPFYCFGWLYTRYQSPLDGWSDGDGEMYDIGDGGPRSVNMSVYVMELPGYYGHFSVRRHSAVRRIFGRNDVETGHPEFDRHFTVQGQDPQAAAYALRGPLADFLLADERSKDCGMWFLGDRLVCAYESRFAPEDVEPALEHLTQVIGRLAPPAYPARPQTALWDDVVPQGGPAGY